MILQNITSENIKKYGCLIDFVGVNKKGFEVVTSEPFSGWRIAIFEFNRKIISRLEKHPNSMESFEPLTGIGVIVLAEPDQPELIEAFLLDHPICLYKGIWHEVLSLSDSTTIKITENNEVRSKFHTLKHDIGISLNPL